jgi:hypothetical protein
MARKKRSSVELQEASNHLQYEIWMLHAVANGMASGLFGPGAITNALVESFAVHVRGLVDCLYSDHPRPDDVIAEDFFSDAALWLEIRPDPSAGLLRAKKRAGKEIAHLTRIEALAVRSDSQRDLSGAFVVPPKSNAGVAR